MSLEMLESEEGQLNAVFACFGSAAQHAQLFEESLGEFLVVHNKLTNKHLTVHDFEIYDQKNQKKTLGALLTEFKKHVTVSHADVTDLLDQSLQKRNFLMHYFFRERREEFSTELGRMELLTELVEIGECMRQATALTGGMRVALIEALSQPKAKTDSADSKSPALFSIEVAVSK